MLNIGIIEFLIIIFFVVLFVKPKDIPAIIKNLGLFYRKIERYFHNMKYEFSEIESEIENINVKKTKNNEIRRTSKRAKKKDTL